MDDSTPAQGDYAVELEAAKSASTGQLLFKAARLWNEAAIARVVALGASGLRVSHTAVFPHIDLDGTRNTDIAERMGISKQAVGRLVDDLAQMGLVARVPDPRDGRAQLVIWTEKGRAGLLHGLDVLRQMEAELAAELGVERLESLRQTLGVLTGALDRR